jgi:hypothetical protein
MHLAMAGVAQGHQVGVVIGAAGTAGNKVVVFE